MADDVMGKAAADAKAVQAKAVGTTVAERPESRADRARRLAYRSRFAALYVLLAVVAGAGVGALLVLVGRGSPAPAPAWSAWEPSGSTGRRAAQIAEHVSDPYRLPSGNTLVSVKSGPPTTTFEDGTTFLIETIAVYPDTTGGRQEANDIDTFPADGTVMYTMCGAAKGCVIREGQPSPARGQLLRRMALELSLYSFTYLDGIDSVVVLTPPAVADEPSTSSAVFIRRSDVRQELSVPLAESLPSPLAPAIGEISAEERRVIDRTTGTRVYDFDAWRTQDGSAILALAPALGG